MSFPKRRRFVNCQPRGGFPRDDLAERLAPIAKRLNLRAGTRLDTDTSVYFPVDGIATLVLERESARFQVGFAGRGEVIGLQRLFTDHFPLLVAEVFRGGDFICVSVPQLSELAARDGRLKERLAVYALKAAAQFLDEAAETVALTLERRVARWIARCRNVIGSDLILVTHHDLSRALGVRRSGVTVALHVLEGEHLIRSRRGRIEVLDLRGLDGFAQSGPEADREKPGLPYGHGGGVGASVRIVEDNQPALT